jgi:hypothetical protein
VRLQIGCRRQQKGALVVEKAKPAVALDAKKTACPADQVAMVDAKPLAGSLADRAGAALPLEHRLVVRL